MNKKYIVLKDVLIQGVNAESSYLTGGVSIATYLGFLDGFKFYLNKDENVEKGGMSEFFETKNAYTNIRDGVSLLIKNYSYNEGIKRIPNTLENDKRGSLNPAFFQPMESNYDIHCSLIMELSTDITDLRKIKEKFINYLKISKIGGGRIFNLSYVLKEGVYIMDSLNEINEKFKKQYYWQVHSENELFSERIEECGVVNAIRDFTFAFKDESEKELEKKYYKKEKGWYFLSLTGYEKVEKESKKHNSRNQIEHAYAEPLIGLFSLKYFKGVSDEDFFIWEKKDNSYIIKQKGERHEQE